MDKSLFHSKASYMLLSTNPKLTTNIKLILDSQYNLYLESFDANLELSNVKFKKFKSSCESYHKDVYNFYLQGKFPQNFAYENFSNNKNFDILKDFSNQYNSFYKYGAERKVSNLYTESMSIFAPLWVNEYVPDYFIIFKTKGTNLSTINTDLFKNSEIIKTIDLTEKTVIGNYIRNHSKELPDAPLYISFDDAKKSFVKGIDYTSGRMVEKEIDISKELLYSDKTVIENDYLITKLFENNGVILANILNMEFLFDDDTELDFNINRYFGLYVYEKEEGELELDIQSFYSKAYSDRFQELHPADEKFYKDNIRIKNDRGCLLYLNDITPYKFDDIKDLNTFFYIKDVNNEFQLINHLHKYENDELRINSKQINTIDYNSENNDSYFVDIDALQNTGYAHVVFEVINEIPETFGIKFFENNNFLGDLYSDPFQRLENITKSDLYFCGTGSTSTIAKSIALIINNTIYQLDAYSINNKVVVKSKFGGVKFNQLRFEYVTRELTPELFILNYSNNYSFVGGANANSRRYRFNVNELDIFTNRYVDTIRGLEEGEISFYIDDISKFNNYRVLTLNNEPKIFSAQISVSGKYKPKYGRFVIFPVKDFNVDTISNNYELHQEFEFEKKYYLDNLDQLQHNDIDLFFESNTYYELQNYNNNEYNNLNENSNIDFVGISKIDPFINKWVYVNGHDVRNREYRLNNCSVFGVYNNTPSFDIKTQNINAFTHEWFNIKGIPSGYLESNDNLDTVLNYVEFDSFDESMFLSNEIDYFTKHFIWDTINNVKLQSIHRNFSLFQFGNSINFAEAFFKGFKVYAKKKQTRERVAYNINSLKFIKDNTYNDYKFSILLVNNPNINTKQFKVIKNDKFKFIILLVYINIDFKLDNTLTYLQDQILNKSTIYALTSKIDGEDINGYPIYSNIRMFGALNLERSRKTTEYYIIYGAADKENISTAFNDQIAKDKNGNYFDIQFDCNGYMYTISGIFKIVSNNILYARSFTKYPLSDPSQVVNITSFPIINPNRRDLTYVNYDTNISTSGYLIVNGGYGIYKNIIETFSFAAITNDFNTGNPYIEYVTADINGEIVDDEFVLSFEKPNLFPSPNYLTSTIDKDKPIIFNFIDIIGHRLKISDVSISPFYRYSGYYTPSTYDIFNFYPTDDITGEDRYLPINLRNVNNIKYLYFNKLTNTTNKILELSDNDKFKSLYPLINEYCFGYENFTPFITNWDSNYYINYLSKTISENIVLKSERETKNYFGSKLCNVPNEIELNTFNSFSVENNKTFFNITVIISDMLLEYFSEKMLRFFHDIEESKKYCQNNIINVYESYDISFYLKATTRGSGVDTTYMTADEYTKQSNGLKIVDNFSIEKLNNLDFSLKYNRTKDETYFVGFKVKLRII